MTNFIHLHVHSDFSMLDGKGTVKDYIKRAKKLGMSALSLTDHGNIAGTYEFYTECIAAGIEPLLGEEFYFVPNADHVKDDKDAERFHVVMLARNAAGYETLVRLSTEAHRRFYYKPLIDRKLLSSLSKRERRNLVVLSGCAAGRLSRMAVGAIPGDPETELQWWLKHFPNYFIELQHHGTKFDRKLNRALLGMARRFEVPWVITNDPHYVLKSEACHHDALLAIQTASDIDNPNRFKFDGSGYHLRSAKEMEAAFADYGSKVWVPGARQTVEVAKMCHTRIPAWDSRSWHIPKFPRLPEGTTADKYLRKLAFRELERKGLANDVRYVERTKHELAEFKKVGMAHFLLIQADINAYARSIGIRVGPGRGSVCGTLVGYLIGIHGIDPIHYDLLFERFLNPERPKMPDIDIDYPRSRRPEMFPYVEGLYGAENTMRVGAYDTMQTKSAFGSLAKSYGISFQQAQLLSQQIRVDEEGNALLPESIVEGFPDMVATMEAITGIKKGIHRHPAGVMIFDPADPIRKLIPEMWIPSSKQFVSQFDLDAAAGIGLMKQDFLGLRTLDTIEVCVKFVKDRHDVELDPDSWIPDQGENDAGIYKMLNDGDVFGVFQMEGGTNSQGIQDIGCTQFEDIVSCTSLFRKGPMDAGADKRFLRNKKKGKPKVLHPKLMPFLGKTWGEMIYQEQMFEILRQLAGFTWARVDDAKTAMTKKDAEKMAALRDEAVAGFRKVGGLPAQAAEKLWAMIQAQAGYLFNRSHAVAYSFLTYQTARLKFEYPLEFCAALLATVEGDNKEEKIKREGYMAACLARGYRILPPDINESGRKFTPIKTRTLRFGLEDIKGVGEKAAERLLSARERASFASLADVAAAANNKAVLDALKESGALERFDVKTTNTKQEARLNWQFEDHMAIFRKKYAKKVRLPNGVRTEVRIVGELTRSETRRTKNGDPFMTWTVRWQPGQEFKINLWQDAEDVWDLQKGSVVMVEGKWSQQWNNMAIGDPDDVRILKKVLAQKKKKVAA